MRRLAKTYGQQLIPINMDRQYLNGRIISNAYQEGDVDGAMIGCSQCVGLIHETKSVKEVIENMMQKTQSILQKLNAMKE